jgi:phage terminase large subunit
LATVAPEKNPLVDWIRRYNSEDGIILFAREQLNFQPDEHQEKLLRAVARRERRISVRSGHGVGKTATLAVAIIWHALIKFPQKTVCTAPTSGQLFDALASEVKSWIGKLPPTIQDLLEIKAERIELRAAPSESYVAFNTSRPEKPEAMAGVHSKNVLLIGDEASGIPEAVFEAAIGSMSGHSACTILAGNPVRTSGLFFDTHHKLRGEWFTHHISCENHPRVSDDFIKQVRDTYGEDSNAYRVRVLGEFPKADDDTVFPFELVEASLKRDVAPHQVKQVWGLDVARFGTDRTALARRRGNVLTQPVQTWGGLDLMQTVGRVAAEYNALPLADRPQEILVDVIGLGSGVVDRLRELGIPVRGINVAESPALAERYRNLKAELTWKAREWFDKRDVNIAGDELLAGELVGIKYKHTSNGKLQIETKDEYRKRTRKSPDVADAFILTFAGTAIAALHGSSGSSNWKQPIRRQIKGLV